MWMIAAAAIFTLNATVVKVLVASGIDSFQAIFVRSLAGLLIPLPFIWYFGVSVRARFPPTQVGQGAVGMPALISRFYVWTKLPFVLIFAAALLSAHVSRQRLISTICAFGRALLIIKPGFTQMQPASVAPARCRFWDRVATHTRRRAATKRKRADNALLFRRTRDIDEISFGVLGLENADICASCVIAQQRRPRRLEPSLYLSCVPHRRCRPCRAVQLFETHPRCRARVFPVRRNSWRVDARGRGHHFDFHVLRFQARGGRGGCVVNATNEREDLR